MRRYLIFLKPVPEPLDHITSEIGYLFHGHQNWIQYFAQHAVTYSIFSNLGHALFQIFLFGGCRIDTCHPHSRSKFVKKSY